VSTPPRASSTFHADLDELRTAGATLATLGGDGRALRPTALVGADPQVETAVAALLQTWTPALDAWGRSLSALGRAVSRAGDAIAAVDGQQATSWSALPVPTRRPLP